MSAQQQEVHVERVDHQAEAEARQILRRHVNDRIGEITDRHQVPAASMDVMCECVRADCQGLISIRVADFQALRKVANRFIVKAGHEISFEEWVVADGEDHVVVARSNLFGADADGRPDGGL